MNYKIHDLVTVDKKLKVQEVASDVSFLSDRVLNYVLYYWNKSIAAITYIYPNNEISWRVRRTVEAISV